MPARHIAVDAEVRLYDRTCSPSRSPRAARTVTGARCSTRTRSTVLTGCKLEPIPAGRAAGADDRFQFERTGYFCLDRDSKPDALVLNRTVALRDSWAKIAKKG